MNIDTLKDIARIAELQRTGPYSAQSDGVTALNLIEKLATLLITEYSNNESKTAIRND